MSRARYCMTNDRDGFIEELAADLWEERHGGDESDAWSRLDAETQARFRKLAAETLRILEHGHG